MNKKFIDGVKLNVKKLLLEKAKERKSKEDITAFCEDPNTPGVNSFVDDVMCEMVQLIEITAEDFTQEIEDFFENVEEIWATQREFNSENDD